MITITKLDITKLIIKALNFSDVFLYMKETTNLNIVMENQKNEPNLVACYLVATFCRTAYGDIHPPKEV